MLNLHCAFWLSALIIVSFATCPTNALEIRGSVAGTVNGESNLVDGATVDGLWQLSETPIDVIPDTQYGKMRIDTVDAANGIITMDNKGEEINLTRKIDTELMPGFGIRTSDNDTLRYYLYKAVTIK